MTFWPWKKSVTQFPFSMYDSKFFPSFFLFSNIISSKRSVSKKGNPALVITQTVELPVRAPKASTKIVRQVISKNSETNATTTSNKTLQQEHQEQIQKYKQQIQQQRQEQIQKQVHDDSVSDVVIAGKGVSKTPASSLETKSTTYTVHPKIPETVVENPIAKPTTIMRDDIYFLERQNFTDYDYFLKYLPEHVFRPAKEAEASIYTNMRDSVLKKFGKVSKKTSDTSASFEGKS